MMFTTCMDHFPEGVVLLGSDRVLYANTMAVHYLPQLTAQAPIPAELDLPWSEDSGAGVFSAGLTTYTFSHSRTPEGTVLFFRPAPQTALTDLQLDGALQQLRAFLGEFAMEIGPYSAPGASPVSPAALADFSKSYHRAFRLLNNLDYLRQAATPEGVPFTPAALDLADLCAQLTQSAAPLLEQTGTRLEFQCSLPVLLTRGDVALLRTLLLGLIANSAQAARGGQIVLRLQRRGNRALLHLSDSGAPLSQRELAALLQQDNDHSLPLPGQGAGLGLTVARHIVSLHQGALLVEWGERSPSVLIALPIHASPPHVTAHTPAPDSSGGLDPLLVGLADVLPADLFGLEGLE